MNQSRRQGRNREAFALIVTVIILSLLGVMAVAFLSSSRVERGTSRAVADTVKAELAAQTAVNTAIARLTDNLTSYPDSATCWEKVYKAGSTTDLQYQGTLLYYREQTPEATAAGAPSPLHVLPLISGAQAVQIWPTTGGATVDDQKRSALPVLDDTNSFDLNRARFSGDLQGAIGAPTGATARPDFRGQWTEVKDSDSKVTARYAYWMEDESFKANVNLMGNTLRGSTSLGAAPSEIPLQGLFKTVLSSGDPIAVANDVFNFRGGFPSSLLFEFRELNHTSSLPTLAETAKFEATIFSGALNTSRSGSKRINLNKVVSTSTDATEIRKQLDEIIKGITYHLPNFGQRFYRIGTDKNSLDVPDTSTAPHRTIYLNKIAANIRDYIDTDSQPTIVNNDPPNYTVQIGTSPVHSVPGGGASGSNEVVAIGKDSVPLMQEYLLRVKMLTFSARLGPSATYKLEIDHYIEFWNMTNKDITVGQLGSNPFLRIANQFGWDANGATNIPVSPTRDFSVPLSSFKNSDGKALVFSAGTATVLTTDQTPLPGAFPGVDPTRVYRPPAGTPADEYRVYSGTTTKKNPSNLRIDSITRPVGSSSAADLETELILGNDNGVLESFGAPAVWYLTVNVDDATSSTGSESTHFNTNQYYFRASSLKGNTLSPIVSQVGDPRTNNDQLSVTTSVANDDQTAYKLEAWNSPSQISNTTFTALNSNYVNPALWVDVGSNVADASHAPGVVANAPLTSIGQLGDIFDAVRSVGATPTGSGNIIYSRGGGRTFKIGQPERYDVTTNTGGLWDGNSNSASREWTAWKLTDIFSATDSVQLDGRININGVNRDGGVALKAALYGYQFQAIPDSDPNLAGKGFDIDPTDTTDKINELVKQMQARIKNDSTTYGSAFANTLGPFAERGELSELPIFNTGSNLVGTVNTANVNDRGREELFRRLVELTTTRGNIFTVYAAGQSVIPRAGSAPIVTSTSQLSVTFRIDPVWDTGTPTDPYDPNDSTATANRFKKPSKYAVKILYATE
jgi:hypothetical protein